MTVTPPAHEDEDFRIYIVRRLTPDSCLLARCRLGSPGQDLPQAPAAISGRCVANFKCGSLGTRLDRPAGVAGPATRRRCRQANILADFRDVGAGKASTGERSADTAPR
jgi:hypothetical protein